jgi:hypothetical protein
MTTITENLTAKLVALHTALVDKTGEQPFIAPSLRLEQSGTWGINLYRGYNNGKYSLGCVTAKTPDECLVNAFLAVSDMPNTETKARADWHKDLGNVIDKGHALNLPDEVMKPLRASSQAMTENLLAAPTGAA